MAVMATALSVALLMPLFMHVCRQAIMACAFSSGVSVICSSSSIFSIVVMTECSNSSWLVSGFSAM